MRFSNLDFGKRLKQFLLYFPQLLGSPKCRKMSFKKSLLVLIMVTRVGRAILLTRNKFCYP
jgi:hypothetical protein